MLWGETVKTVTLKNANSLHSSTRHSNSLGMTLVELLVVLSLLSLFTLISGAWLKGSLPSLTTKQAVHQLQQDLSEARLSSLLSGESVIILITEDEYTIPQMSITQSLPKGVMLSVSGAIPIQFTNGLPNDGFDLKLHHGTTTRNIKITPLTGRIYLDE